MSEAVNDRAIVGYKKGGGGGGIHEDPDTLKSTAYAQLLMALCEGEIEGPGSTQDDLEKSIYLDGTRLTNDDGSANFNLGNGVFAWQAGTQAQAYLPSFSDSESETAVNVEIKKSAAVTRTFSDSNVDAVRVTVSVHGIYKTHGDGRITGTSVDLHIELDADGGGFNTVLTDKIKGKSTGHYQRSYRIPLARLTFPISLKLVRDTDDNHSATLNNQTYWDSYTEIIDAKLRYPNTALLAARIDSTQFDHVPTVGLLTKLLKVQIPTNYDPNTRAYAGSWDGTFKIAWTDNPAWCFYDLLTESRYGLGNFVPVAQVDKWALYTIAQYCDSLVDDGHGGAEPRFTCNLYLQRRAEAFTVLQQFVSIFRSILYWAGGTLIPVQDAPADPVALYTNANVVDGTFTYQGAPLNARHSVALVTWNDPDNLYKQKVEYVEDPVLVAKYGLVQTETTAVGCTSQGQAQRVGRWLLQSEQQSETVNFVVGLEGALARPGQIIDIADANRAGERRGGRVIAATTTQITLDAPVTLEAATVYTLSLIAPGGVLADGTVQSVASETTTDVLTLTAALAAAPSAGAIWVLASPNLEPQQFRVLSVTEHEKNQFAITALVHNPDKYTAIDTGTRLVQPVTSGFIQPLEAPQGFTIQEWADTAQAGVVRTDLVFGWQTVPQAAGYELTYTIADDDQNTVRVHGNSYNEIVHHAGAISATVRAISIGGTPGKKATATQTTIQPAPVPQQIASMTVTARDGLAYGKIPGISVSQPASQMSVVCGYANSAAGVPEPVSQFQTDIVTCRSNQNTRSATRAIFSQHTNPNYTTYLNEFLVGRNPYALSQQISIDVTNQYGNTSAAAVIAPHAAIVRKSQVSATDTHACYPYCSAQYQASPDANQTATILITSFGDNDMETMTVAPQPPGYGVPEITIGTPYSGVGFQDGDTWYYHTWSVEITHADLAAGETRYGVVICTITFKGGGQVGVPFNFVAARVDQSYGYKPH